MPTLWVGESDVTKDGFLFSKSIRDRKRLSYSMSVISGSSNT